MRDDSHYAPKHIRIMLTNATCAHCGRVYVDESGACPECGDYAKMDNENGDDEDREC